MCFWRFWSLMERFGSVSCGQTHNMECVSVTAVYLWESWWAYWSVSDKTHTPGDFVKQTPKKYKHTLMFHHLSCISPTHTHTQSDGLIVMHLTHTKYHTRPAAPVPFFDISLMGPSALCVCWWTRRHKQTACFYPSAVTWMLAHTHYIINKLKLNTKEAAGSSLL